MCMCLTQGSIVRSGAKYSAFGCFFSHVQCPARGFLTLVYRCGMRHDVIAVRHRRHQSAHRLDGAVPTTGRHWVMDDDTLMGRSRLSRKQSFRSTFLDTLAKLRIRLRIQLLMVRHHPLQKRAKHVLAAIMHVRGAECPVIAWTDVQPSQTGI